MDIRTDSTMSKAEYSRTLYRKSFETHEPNILKFLDGFINEFGRDQIKNLMVYCPTK